MGEKVARIGDTAVGYCDGPGHAKQREFVGVWVTGSEDTFVEGAGVVRVGDTGKTDCGHVFVAATGSETVFVNGCSVHRVGDVCLVEDGGVGVTTTGAETTFSGE